MSDIKVFVFVLQLCMRPCALVVPDVKMIIEATLHCNGFANHKPWSGKLAIFFKLLGSQVKEIIEPIYVCESPVITVCMSVMLEMKSGLLTYIIIYTSKCATCVIHILYIIHVW